MIWATKREAFAEWDCHGLCNLRVSGQCQKPGPKCQCGWRWNPLLLRSCEMRGFYLESRFVNQGFEAWSMLHWVWIDVGTQPGFKPLNAFEAVLSCYKNSTWAIDRWWMRLQSGGLTHPLILTKMPWVRWWAVLILQQFTAQGAIFVGPRRGRDTHQQITHAFFHLRLSGPPNHPVNFNVQTSGFGCFGEPQFCEGSNSLVHGL